jgi:CheY-like chemotaxis protein
MAAKKPGALAFSGAVIMPVLGSLLCLAALKYPDLHPAAAQGGLWGLAVGGLGLALARVPRNAAGPGTGDENNEGLTMPDTPGGLSAAFSVLSPQSQYEELPPMPVERIGGDDDAEGTPRGGAGPEDGQRGGDASADGKAGLLRTPGERPEKAQDIAFFLPPKEDRSYLDLPSEVMNILEGPVPTGNMQPGSYPFNLHTLVRQVHDIVSPLAESKGLIFSWYMSPSLPVLLEGDSPRLRGALILLLQSAVQAADGGAVQLAVRRNPMTSFEGDLLFSISDNGSAQRTDAGFFLAWELASRTGGAFTVDYSAAGGTRTAFTVRFRLFGGETSVDFAASALPSLIEPESAAPPPRIGGTRSLCILPAEMTGGARRHIARCLEGVPHTAVNAFDEEQLLRLAGEHEPDLVIFDADMPENDIARCIVDLRVDESAKGRKRAAVLVLTGHDLQATRLLEAGAGYVLGKPFTREAFLDVLSAAVPSAAPRIRALGAAAADRAGMFAQPVHGLAPDVSAPHGDTDRDAAAGAFVAESAARASGAPLPSLTAPDRSGQSRVENGADDDHVVKLPIPARLIPRSIKPDEQPFGEPSPGTAPGTASASDGKSEAAPAPGTASASEGKSEAAPAPGTASASEGKSEAAPIPGTTSASEGKSEAAPAPGTTAAFKGKSEAAPAPGTTSAFKEKSEAAPGEAEDSDAAKLPRPARLIPRGMAVERPEGERGRDAAPPVGASASDAYDEPDSALMPGQPLSRDPFLDPSVAFLRPTFTPPGRSPLRDAVKLATGLEASSAVSDAPEAPAKAAGRDSGLSRSAGDASALPATPAEDGNGKFRTVPDARKTRENASGGRNLPLTRQSRPEQSADAPLRDRGQGNGTVDAQAAQQTQAGPRTGVHLQVQAQPAAAKRLSFSSGKGDGVSDPARQAPGVAGVGREHAGGGMHAARHVTERPDAVQVQLPPRHGIPPKGETDAGTAENTALKKRQPAGTPQAMQVSVHSSRNSAGAVSSPRVPRTHRGAQSHSGQHSGASSAQLAQVRDAQIESGGERATLTEAGHAAAAQVRTAPEAAAQARTAPEAAAQARIAPAATAQARTSEADAGRDGATRTGAGQVSTGRLGTVSAETGQAGVARTGSGQAESGHTGSGQAGGGQAGAPRGEEQSPFENMHSDTGGGIVPATIGRAASDAAPMVMGLSPEDVAASAAGPGAAPYRRAETGKRGLSAENLLDLDAIRAADTAGDGKQPGAAREREAEKHPLSGSLIDFMLLDPEQDDADTGTANRTEKTNTPRVAAGKAEFDIGAANGTGRQFPSQAEKNAAGKANFAADATAGPALKADTERSKAAPQSSAGNIAASQPASKAPVPKQTASQPVSKAPLTNVPASQPAKAPITNVPASQPVSKAPLTNVPASLPVPLPGLDGEFLDPDALPFLPGLEEALIDALRDAAKGMDELRLPLVQEASSRMASRAEHFGLNRLGRLARCLERAAEAQDEEASRTILEDLRRAVQQYKKALAECRHSFAGIDG